MSDRKTAKYVTRWKNVENSLPSEGRALAALRLESTSPAFQTACLEDSGSAGGVLLEGPHLQPPNQPAQNDIDP